MKTVIVINRHRVAANRRAIARGEETQPVISVRRGRAGVPHYPAYSIYVGAPCHIVYEPTRPLSCGATVWLETDDDVLARYP